MPEETRDLRVVYTVPYMDAVQARRNLLYTTVDGIALHADVYLPPDANGLLPAAILVAGSGPWDLLKDIKDHGVYLSYGELLAASGLAAVTFNHRSPRDHGHAAVASDVDDLVAWVRERADDLGIDRDRLALWAFSGGPPFGLRSVLRDAPPYVRCILSFYGIMDYRHVAQAMPFLSADDVAEYSPAHQLAVRPQSLPPIFLAKAGKDHPELNKSIDRFVDVALHLDLTLDLMTHPEGRHAFDILDADDRSRQIVRRAIGFLQEHLHGR